MYWYFPMDVAQAHSHIIGYEPPLFGALSFVADLRFLQIYRLWRHNETTIGKKNIEVG